MQQELDQVYAGAVDRVSSFLDDSLKHDATTIPTAILATDPDASSYNAVIDQIADKKKSAARRAVVSIAASTASNLKGLLKVVIQKATSPDNGLDEDDDEEAPRRKKGSKLLNYDLQLLADGVKELHLDQIIVAIGETEAFDNTLLSEFIEHLRCWYDRIPFVLIFSVATPPETLQHRLSSAAVGCLDGVLLDIATTQRARESTIEALVADDPALYIGADLSKLMLERQSDYVQSNDSLTRAMQYAYMSHYYANPLSIFLIPDIKSADIPKTHFEALRNVASFRTHCRELLDSEEATQLRTLLDSDSELFKLVRQSIAEARSRLSLMMSTVRFLQAIQQILGGTSSAQVTSFSTLYNLALSGDLTVSSNFVRTMLLSIRKSPASVVSQMLLVETPNPTEDFAEHIASIADELASLATSADNRELHSEFDVHHSTLRTTVVAQKVELSKHKAKLSKQDEDYTKLVKRYSDLLEQLLTTSLIDPESLVFHELIVYDLRSPLRETFMPKPRNAIERALAVPHDYLDCECCAPDRLAAHGTDPDQATLSASQPATAVLYQLYLESGTLINVSDLQQAFTAVIGEGAGDDGEVAALFQRALAELRYLGLVKSTGKRVDHIGKAAWKGL